MDISSNALIIEWIDEKLSELCRCIVIFVNYILIPRDGYTSQQTTPLSLAAVRYVVEELFNCVRVGDSKSDRSYYPVDFSVRTRKLLSATNRPISVSGEVVDYIWKYISYAVANLTGGKTVESETSRVREQRRKSLREQTARQISEIRSAMTPSQITVIANLKLKKYNQIGKKLVALREKVTLVQSSKKTDEVMPDDYTFTDDEAVDSAELGVSQRNRDKLLKYRDLLALARSSDPPLEAKSYTLRVLAILSSVRSVLSAMIKEVANSDISQFLKRREIRPQSPNEVYTSGDIADFGIRQSDEILAFNAVRFNDTREYTGFLTQINSALDKNLVAVDSDDSIAEVADRGLYIAIKSRIELYRYYVSSTPCKHSPSVNLPHEIDNCIFQSLLYLAVSISDWHETSTIGSAEIGAALSILLSLGEKSYINELVDITDDSTQFMRMFVGELNRYSINIDASSGVRALAVVVDAVGKIKELDVNSKEYNRFNNRVRYFSNSLVA